MAASHRFFVASVLAGRARGAPPRGTPTARGGGGSRRAVLRLVGTRLWRCERTRSSSTTGQTHPSRRSATAGSPVARLRTRTISVSQSSPGTAARRRGARDRPAPARRRRGRRGVLSRAWLLAMLDRSEEAWQDARGGGREARELSDARWPDWWLAELLEPRRRPRGREQPSAHRLRLARSDGPARVPQGLPGAPRPFTVHARPLRRSGGGRRARAIARRGARYPVPDYSWRQVLARVRAHRGELAEAERLAREAVAVSEESDLLNEQCVGPLGPGRGPGGRRSPRRCGSRVRAGARPLPAQEEPRAGPPGARTARGAAGWVAAGAVTRIVRPG